MKLKVAGKNRGLAWTIALTFMPVGALVCDAGPITYNVNRTVGLGSITGFIQTDGTTSVPLAAANIVDWKLTETDGSGNTITLTGPNSGSDSEVLLEGNDLTATATDLYFNFSGSDRCIAAPNIIVTIPYPTHSIVYRVNRLPWSPFFRTSKTTA
jgi:hypothetical protein